MFKTIEKDQRRQVIDILIQYKIDLQTNPYCKDGKHNGYSSNHQLLEKNNQVNTKIKQRRKRINKMFQK